LPALSSPPTELAVLATVAVAVVVAAAAAA
jgi:hypothetical protein